MKNSSAKTLQSSLCSANFILLVLGQGISLFGNTMLRFAMSMWVLDETARSNDLRHRAGHIRHSDHTY